MENSADLIRFIDWLKSLTPKNETPLILRQRPRLDGDGQLQYHADGAIKATWLAFLPEPGRIKPDQAWYGNTASFIIDRFTDGKISASAANC